MIIYKTTNLINGKIYVGKDYKNKPTYYGSGIQIIRAIRKYGRINFKKEILEQCTIGNIDEREKHWIATLNARDRKIGYNIDEGGNRIIFGTSHPMYGTHPSEATLKKMSKRRSGKNHPMYGKHHSEETKTKQSLAKIGKKASDEARKKMSLARKGRSVSEKTKKKMSDVRRQNKDKYSGKNSFWFGKHHSYETRQKMKLSNKKAMLGRHQSDEAKARMSVAKRRENLSQETLLKMSASQAGKNNGMFGRRHTKEAIEMMSKARVGKTASDATKEKMSKARSGEKHPMFGKRHTEEAKRKMSDTQKQWWVKKKLGLINK